jgi:hypothetical protein
MATDGMAYLYFILIISEWPQGSHANVRRSWSSSSAGSMRTSIVSEPQRGQGGRYNAIGFTWFGSRGHMFEPSRQDGSRARRLKSSPSRGPACIDLATNGLRCAKPQQSPLIKDYVLRPTEQRGRDEYPGMVTQAMIGGLSFGATRIDLALVAPPVIWRGQQHCDRNSRLPRRLLQPRVRSRCR